MSSPLLWSRRLVKSVVAATVGPFLQPETLLILGYHRVVENFDQEVQSALQGSLVSVATFERQLDAIGRNRRFVSLEEVGERLISGDVWRQPVAAVTFDDGYRDVYEQAWPLLERKGIPATVFIVSDLVGTSREQAHDRLYRLLTRALGEWQSPAHELGRLLASVGVSTRRRTVIQQASGNACGVTRAMLTTLTRATVAAAIDLLDAEFGDDLGPAPAGALPLSWDALRAMQQAGATIGSHTRHHALLANERTATARDETVLSRLELEQHLDGPIEHFAYPDGSFNAAAVDAVAAAGYRFGYTTCGHFDVTHPWLTLPRQVMWERSAVDTRGRFSVPLLQCEGHSWLAWRRECTWASHA